jgi:hypothetical protein
MSCRLRDKKAAWRGAPRRRCSPALFPHCKTATGSRRRDPLRWMEGIYLVPSSCSVAVRTRLLCVTVVGCAWGELRDDVCMKAEKRAFGCAIEPSPTSFCECLFRYMVGRQARCRRLLLVNSVTANALRGAVLLLRRQQRSRQCLLAPV